MEFKVGDKIIVIKRNLNDEDRCKTVNIFWNKEMNKYVGEVLTLKSFNGIDFIDGPSWNVEENLWHWSEEWLGLVDKIEEYKEEGSSKKEFEKYGGSSDLFEQVYKNPKVIMKNRSVGFPTYIPGGILEDMHPQTIINKARKLGGAWPFVGLYNNNNDIYNKLNNKNMAMGCSTTFHSEGVIKKVFKCKENKALQAFGLGEKKNLNGSGLNEFLTYLYETNKEAREGFLAKIVEAHEEAKKE